MGLLVILGACVTLTGVVGLVYCAVRVRKALKANLSDEMLRAELQKVVPIKMGVFFLSVLGLIMVIVGQLLG